MSPPLDSPVSTAKDTFSRHLNALHAARKGFIAAKSSDRIKRALKANIRSYQRSYQNDEERFYHADGRWKGPATVIGSDSSVVFLRHSGRAIKVHASKVKPRLRHRVSDCEADPTGDSLGESADSSYSNDTQSTSERTDTEVEVQGASSRRVSNVTSDIDENLKDHTDKHVEKTEDAEKQTAPKKGSFIRVLQPTGEFRKAEIVSRVAKKSGKYSNWYNVQFCDESGELQNLELKPGGENWSSIPENEEKQITLMSSDDSFHDFSDAKVKEVENWRKFNVYEVVNDEGQETLSLYQMGMHS